MLLNTYCGPNTIVGAQSTVVNNTRFYPYGAYRDKLIYKYMNTAVSYLPLDEYTVGAQ